MLTSTDYAGNVTTYTYDNLDRLIEKSNNDGTVNYAYTVDGKISAVTDNSGVTSFTYDNMNGLTRVDYPDGTYVSYSYDNACRLTKVITPFGNTSYEYDLLDRLTRVVDRNGYATVYEYDKNGNRTKVTYANGYTTTYDYDLLNRLIRQETLDSDGKTVVKYVYTLGAAGERRKVTELDRTVEYTYDSLYRLTSETITEGEKTTVYTYAYDNVSNRILKTENGKETEYVYNSLNQLVSDSETTYEYDLNGNLIRVVGLTNSALYEYNAENRLIKATVQSGNNVIVETYTYDYSGNRTSKTTNTNGSVEFVKYLNDNSSLTNVLAEIDETGTAKCTYTVGADLISQERDGKVSVYVYDGHGSVVGIATMSGNVTDTYKYDAFGNLLKSTGSTANNYRYCGEQFDSTTGLYYLRARYMDTSTGRFISQDSYAGSISDPVSLHKYLYANANPVMYTDPSGYMSMAEMGAAGAVIGGLSGLIVPNVVSIFYNLVTLGQVKTDVTPAQNLKNMLSGILFGCFFGICAFTFITLGIIAGLTATFNFGLSYIYYISGQQAAENGHWQDAICCWFLCLFYMIAGFTTIALASMPTPVDSNHSIDNGQSNNISNDDVRFGDNDLDLGLNPELQNFKQNGGKGYGEFPSNLGSEGFCDDIYNAMHQADKIRFNLDGVDFSKVNNYNGETTGFGEPINGNYTNYELWLIRNNPEFLNKTVFYQNGQEVSPPKYFE